MKLRETIRRFYQDRFIDPMASALFELCLERFVHRHQCTNGSWILLMSDTPESGGIIGPVRCTADQVFAIEQLIAWWNSSPKSEPSPSPRWRWAAAVQIFLSEAKKWEESSR